MVKIKVTPVEDHPENSKVVYWVEAAIHQLIDGDYRRTRTRPSADQVVARITKVAEEVVSR